jgi:hypothetical protein
MPTNHKSDKGATEIKPIADIDFFRQKENQKQTTNGIEILIGEEKIKQRLLSLEGEKIKTEISRIGVDIVLESKQQTEHQLAVAREKTQQSRDSLTLELGRTKINAEKCLLEAEKLSSELSQAKQQLAESQSHFKLVSGQF